MKMGLFLKIFGIVLMLISIILLVYLLVVYEDQGDEIKEVPCYDRFGNEIKDLVCEEKVNSDFIGNIIVTCVICVIGLFMFILGDLNDTIH